MPPEKRRVESLSHGCITVSQFRAAVGLVNCHLQTILPTFVGRATLPQVSHERLELEDGDYLQLTWNRLDGTGALRISSGTLLLMHGLEGSWRSPYARHLLATAASRGLRACVVHFRGCGDSANRLDRSYHSGDTQDLRQVIAHVRACFPSEPIYVAGYSLGGNVLLKLLGEDGVASPVRAAVAVSVPMVLGESAHRLNRGFSRFYQWWFLRTLKAKVLKKFAGRTRPPICLERVRRARTMADFDDAATAPLHGFRDAEHYYALSSSRQYLRQVARPTLIIQARDDPFMTNRTLPSAPELAPSITLELAERGGHVGYVAARDRGGARWLARRIMDWFDQHQA